MSFTWGFILGWGFGMTGLMLFVGYPVLLEHLRQLLDDRLREIEEENEAKK